MQLNSLCAETVTSLTNNTWPSKTQTAVFMVCNVNSGSLKPSSWTVEGQKIANHQ